MLGYCAVVDSTADEVYIFDPDGILKSQFETTSFGSSSPLGITFISSGPYDGNLAIVDNVADQIFVVNTSGVLQKQCDTAALGSTNATGITYISSGSYADNLAVVDATADRVFIVDFDCNPISSWLTSTFSSNPVDIAYVSTTDYFAILGGSTIRVTLTNTVGVFQEDFSVQFVAATPRGLSYMPTTGTFAVADDSQDEVFIISTESKFLSSFSTALFGSTSPVGITCIPTTGNYAIIDDAGDEVFFVNSSEALQGQCDISAFSGAPKGIAFIPSSGNFAVVDSTLLEVFISGLTFLPGATGHFAVVDSFNGDVFIQNANGGLMARFDTAGVLSATTPRGSPSIRRQKCWPSSTTQATRSALFHFQVCSICPSPATAT